MERIVLPNDTLAEPLQSPLSDAELQQRVKGPHPLTTQEVLEHWRRLR